MEDISIDIKRKVTAVIYKALSCNPPHYVDICTLDNGIPIWHTIEPMNDTHTNYIQCWDITFKRFHVFKWSEVADAKLNTLNYIPATKEEWERRILITNLQLNENMIAKQSVGRYW